jgi:hypothetical protein
MAGGPQLAREQTCRRDHEPGALGQAHGNDPYASLKDILERPPTQPAGGLDALLPWRRATAQPTRLERRSRS